MSAETDFKTLDGAAWAKALAEARKRRKSQGKRISDALPCSDSWPCRVHLHGVKRLGRARYACAKCERDASFLVVMLHESGCDVDIVQK